jgi:hypothetical protein
MLFSPGLPPHDLRKCWKYSILKNTYQTPTEGHVGFSLKNCSVPLCGLWSLFLGGAKMFFFRIFRNISKFFTINFIEKNFRKFFTSQFHWKTFRKFFTVNFIEKHFENFSQSISLKKIFWKIFTFNFIENNFGKFDKKNLPKKKGSPPPPPPLMWANGGVLYDLNCLKNVKK